MTFAPLGDSAVVVTLGATMDESVLLRVRALAAALHAEQAAGVVDVVPAYTTITVFYDAGWRGADETPPFERICELIRHRATNLEHAWPDRLRVSAPSQRTAEEAAAVEIPVCYGGEFGPDIAAVAQHSGLHADEVVKVHATGKYLVHAVGFTPGFPYLGGLSEKLFTPRRASPRISVPAGSVGIGWKQTGVYPIASPGGWQIIGRTPLVLFRAGADHPALLSVGDRVRFKSITAEEFERWT